MTSALIAAIIAGSVSILVSVVGHIFSLRRLRREMHQKLHTKLIDLRIEHYPEAFEITSILGKKLNLTGVEIVDTYRTKLSELLTWKQGIPGMIMSKESEKRYAELIEALKAKPGHGKDLSPEQYKKIWRLRQRFRSSLKYDLEILRKEI